MYIISFIYIIDVVCTFRYLLNNIVYINIVFVDITNLYIFIETSIGFLARFIIIFINYDIML